MHIRCTFEFDAVCAREACIDVKCVSVQVVYSRDMMIASKALTCSSVYVVMNPTQIPVDHCICLVSTKWQMTQIRE